MLGNEEYSSECCRFVPSLSWLVVAQRGARTSLRRSSTSVGPGLEFAAQPRWDPQAQLCPPKLLPKVLLMLLGLEVSAP